jgi:hypothetical protein
MARDTTFTDEETLVGIFLSQLGAVKAPWVTLNVLREFDYISGRTDVVLLSQNDEVIAFEAKLTDWRRALHQAWRNSNFANRVYVVLPRANASAALRHREEFKRRRVGLCLVDSTSLEVVVESAPSDPVIPWLHNKARKTLVTHGIRSDRDVGKNDLPEPQLHLYSVL